MHLTPDILEACYEMLRTTPPFKRWNLPHGDDVVFRVTSTPHHLGQAGHENGALYLEVSGAKHAHLSTLIPTVAHEMVHLHEVRQGVRSDVKHGATFKKFAAQVCRHHGFDPKWF